MGRLVPERSAGKMPSAPYASPPSTAKQIPRRPDRVFGEGAEHGTRGACAPHAKHMPGEPRFETSSELGTARRQLCHAFTGKRMDESPFNPELTPSEEATRRGLSPGATEVPPDGTGHRRHRTTEPKRVEIVLRIVATDPQQTEPAKPGSSGQGPAPFGDSPDGTREARTSSAGSDVSVATIPVGGSPTGAGESPALPAAPGLCDPSQIGERKTSTLPRTATEDGHIEKQVIS